ncbi:hypothetical protein A0257_11440 [Hymenobacter psoromatis]|nr:hypothetical protein A0257_11440 [Hymenobacter psoromatis]
MKMLPPPRRLRAILTAAALAASVMSCNRDQVVPGAPSAVTQTNQELATVAKALAHTLGTEAAYRQLLKAEALKQFDGDYDVLYRAFTTLKPAFGQRMDELVAQSPTGQALTGMADVLAHVPNLNISVPVNINKWDAATYAPLVLFIPADFDEKTYTKPLQAYDKDGQVHLLDAKQAPDYPVVVIGPSERVRGTALTSENFGPGKGAASGQSTTNRVPADDPNYPGDPYYPYPPTPPSTPPQYYATCRTDKQTEYLTSMWMADVSEYESWFLGDPEMRLQAVIPSGAAGTLSGTIRDSRYTMGRKTIEATYNCDADLYFWQKQFVGEAVGFIFTEEDYGDIADVKLSISYMHSGVTGSAEVTFKIANHDDMVSNGIVFFDQCPTKGYYTNGSGGGYEFRYTLANRP